MISPVSFTYNYTKRKEMRKKREEGRSLKNKRERKESGRKSKEKECIGGGKKRGEKRTPSLIGVAYRVHKSAPGA
jgi:hypothetical protein